MDQNQIDQSIRLKKLIKALNLNQSSFAKSLGMTQPNISRMVNGEGKVSVEVINGITKNYTEVNLHWLLTGDGEMFLDSKGLQANEDAVVYGKGWLEGLEERVTRLEREMEQLRKGLLI